MICEIVPVWDLLLLELGFVLFLAFPVLELAVVHEPAYRGLSQRRNLDQIDFRLLRHGHGRGETHDTELLSFGAHEADLRGIDFAVDPQFLVISYRSASLKDQKLSRAVPRRNLFLETRNERVERHLA